MSREHALRHARRSRGVHLDDDVTALASMPRIERLVRGEPALVAAGRGLVNDDQLRDEASPIDQIRRGRREPVARDQHARMAVRENGGELRCREPPVHRHDHRAKFAHGKQQLDYLGSGPVEVGHPVAGPDAERTQCLSEAVRAFVEPAKTELAIPLHDRERVAARGPRPADHVRNPKVVTAAHRGPGSRR